MTDDTKTEPVATLVCLLLLYPLTLLEGWCLHLLWTWFVVPLGLPSIGTIHMVGLSCLYATWRLDERHKTASDSVDLLKRTLKKAVARLALVGIAYFGYAMWGL